MKNKIKRISHSKYANLSIIICFILISILAFSKKNTQLSTAVASKQDMSLQAVSGDIIQQTWQAGSKNITGITVPLASKFSYCGDFSLYLSPSPDFNTSAMTVSSFSNNTGDSINELTFPFEEKTVLQSGIRYYITIVCKELEEPVYFSASSDSDSVLQNGTSKDCALSALVSFEKNSRFFWIYSMLTILCSFALIFMLIFKKNFEQVIAFSLITIVLILYLLGLFGGLAYGAAVLLTLSFFLILISSYLIWKRKIFVADFISPGLLIWLAGFLLIILYNRNMFRIKWDEFSHWGQVVKDMFYFDALSNHAASAVLHYTYPPFISLVQYLFVFVNGVFSESLLYVAMQVTILSCLIILFQNITWKKYKYILPYTVILLFTPMIVFSDVYSTLYVDALLGILMAYSLICFFSEKLTAFNIIRISAVLIALSLTKEMGVIMAGITFLIILFHTIWQEHTPFTKKAGLCFIFFFCILFSFISWQIFVSIDFNLLAASSEASISLTQPDSAERSRISISGILDLIRGNGSSGQYLAIRNFITSFFNTSDFNYNLGPLSFPFFSLLMSLFLFSWGLNLRNSHEDKKSLFQIIFLAALGSFIYGGFLLITYLFAFPYKEMVELSSYYRYMGSYLSAVIITFIFTILIYSTQRESLGTSKIQNTYALLTAGILFLITPFTLIINRPIYTRNLDYLYGYDEIADVARSFGEQTEKVYFICSGSDGFAYFNFCDSIIPMRTGTSPAYTIDIRYEKDKSDGQFSAEAWSNVLKNEGYNYVYIMNADASFISSCSYLFENGAEDITNGTFYRITITTDDSILFIPIAHTPAFS